jgi:hypothetical protein
VIFIALASIFVVAGQPARVPAQWSGADATAGEEAPVLPAENLLTLPSSISAERKLKRPVTYRATNLPLRDVLASFGKAHEISIWLDRRVDPSTKVNLQIRTSLPLEDVLRKIATVAKAEFALVENVCYFGPRKEGQKIQLANLQLHHQMLQFQGAKAASRAIPVSWPELAKPSQLAEKASQGTGLKIGDEVPHDLLHAGKFPSGCTSSTLLSLVAGGFGQRYRLSADTLRLEELPAEGTWQTAYPKDRVSSRVVQQMASTKSIRESSDTWIVSGDTQLHRILLHANLPSPTRRPPTATRLSGDISGTVENIAMQLAGAANLELRWSPAVTSRARGAFVRFQVENKTYQEILERLAEEARLVLKIDSATGVASFGSEQ